MDLFPHIHFNRGVIELFSLEPLFSQNTLFFSSNTLFLIAKLEELVACSRTENQCPRQVFFVDLAKSFRSGIPYKTPGICNEWKYKALCKYIRIFILYLLFRYAAIYTEMFLGPCKYQRWSIFPKVVNN